MDWKTALEVAGLLATFLGIFWKLLDKRFTSLKNSMTELKKDIQEIKTDIKEMKNTITDIDRDLSKLEGSFEERGRWEAGSYKIAKSTTGID